MNRQFADEIHVWVPDLFATKGGIQTYSRFLLQSLRAVLPHQQLRVSSKNDPTSFCQLINDSKIQSECSGDWSSSWRSGAFAFRAGLHGFSRRPKLIITTHVNFALIGYSLYKAAKIPYWIVAHGIDVWNMTRPALKLALKNAELVLAVSNYTRMRLLAEQDLDEDKIVVLPNTFDPSRFQITQKPEYLLRRYGLRKEHPVILTVSRLDSKEQYKGYDKILRVLPDLRRQFPDLCYLIAGKGDDREQIEKMVNENGLGKQVKLIGYIPDEELNDHYNLCDVFAMPSKGEGFGIVFLEALACGKPVLAGNKDGSVDALLNGELGILVDPDNVEEIAAALSRVLSGACPHPIIYDSQALRQRVIEVYGFEQFQQKVAAILTNHTVWGASSCLGAVQKINSGSEKAVSFSHR